MKKIIKHLGIIIFIIFLILGGALWYTSIYTQHNSTLIKVQDLEGMNSDKALELLDDVGLEGVINDTVYKDGVKRLSVINQNPAAGLTVKPGRKVYLVINTAKIPMVEVPDLAEKTSLKQATNILLRRHLKVGNVIKQRNSSVRHRTDEPVLAQYEHGTKKSIKPKTLIKRNSKIDLVIGIPMHHESDSSSVN